MNKEPRLRGTPPDAPADRRWLAGQDASQNSQTAGLSKKAGQGVRGGKSLEGRPCGEDRICKHLMFA